MEFILLLLFSCKPIINFPCLEITLMAMGPHTDRALISQTDWTFKLQLRIPWDSNHDDGPNTK